MRFKIKQLITHINYKSGRNNSGKITVRHRASGVSREVSTVNSSKKFYVVKYWLRNNIVFLNANILIVIKPTVECKNIILLIDGKDTTNILPLTEMQIDTFNYNHLYSLSIIGIIGCFILVNNINKIRLPAPSEGGDGNPSDDDENNASSNNKEDKSIISAITTSLYNNRNIIIGTVIGALVIVGGYLVLNHYGILPSISNIMATTDSNSLSSVPAAEVVNIEIPATTNQIVAEALTEAGERFSREALPAYFENLIVTAENFNAANYNNNFASYADYKRAILERFLTLYAGIDRNVIQLHDVDPGNFRRHNIIHLMANILGQNPQIGAECAEVMKFTVRGQLNEELFLATGSPEHFALFRTLMLRLQTSIHQYEVGDGANFWDGVEL